MVKNKIQSYDSLFTEKDKQDIINDYVVNQLSFREVMKKYNIRSKSYLAKVLDGKMRSISEAGKLAHIKHPEVFLHTEETKAKIREKRLAFMKAHPEKTAWRRSNQSYPEKVFEKFLIERGYADKFLIQREYSFFPYFIDFAFVDLKIAIEIDGSQHLLPERKERDEKKDLLLQENGWRVIRIAESVVKTDWDAIQQVLNEYISLDTTMTFTQVGVVTTPKQTYVKVKRDEFGRSEKQNESAIKQRRVERPDKDTLIRELTESSFLGVGRKYGVSDNAVRKWCKIYGISKYAKDYKKETLE